MTTRVDLWNGASIEIDRRQLAAAAVPVKGVAYHSPLRFLEIFGNEAPDALLSASGGSNQTMPWGEIERTFFPRIPGTSIALGDGVPQPPFAWRDATPWHVCVSFTYNTNAFYRILGLLRDLGRVDAGEVDALLDRACRLLARLYRARDGFLLRNINNNFNMYLISKVIEHLVGKDRYDADLQELGSTQRSLHVALALAADHATLSTREKMAAAVGAGVAFIEKRLAGARALSRQQQNDVQDVVYNAHGRQLAIDDRDTLLGLIEDGCRRRGRFALAVVLDDATETVDDLLWMQDLTTQFGALSVHLLVNTAQVSINFSTHMLTQILGHACFVKLASRRGTQLLITEVYCPFISFQTNYLPAVAREVIDAADAVYVKGANFFETCQIAHKDSFHAFTVFGGVSRSYTGLLDFDRVFACVPAGTEGYRHHADRDAIVPLTAMAARFQRAGVEDVD